MKSSRFRNLFLLFGIGAVLLMLFTFDVSYAELWANVHRAGIYLPLVLLLWLGVYLINTLSWHLILRSGGRQGLPGFARLYKFTVSGFALNYVTPVGLMGGEPYRILELTPYVGVERATSSVILYVMMHISSHFCFWLGSAVLYACLYPVGWETGALLGFVVLFCLLLGHLFVRGYRYGMAVACIRLMGRLPFVGHRAGAFAAKHRERLEAIDRQIALLHRASKGAFYGALALELAARVASSLEIWLILNVLTSDVRFPDCILILAFSSLLANLLFFLPMQLGGREGGFALSACGLSLSGAYGVYAALITRVRELVWILVGLGLMKVGNGKGKV